MSGKDEFSSPTASPENPLQDHAPSRALIHELRNSLATIGYAANLLRMKGATDNSLLPVSELIEKNVRMMGQILEKFGKPMAPPAPLPEAGPTPTGAHRHILVADDNRDFRTTLQAILSALGYEVRAAADGAEAVEMATAWQPDCVLLDAHMPKMNGYEVARKLRSQFPREKMSLVLLSGDNLDAQTVQSAQAYGFDHCLDKTDDTGLQQLLRNGC